MIACPNRSRATAFCELLLLVTCADNYRLGCKGRPFHKMNKKSGTKQSHGEKVVKDIRPATRKQYSAEEKIRIVLDGLKGEDSIAERCRREGIAQSLYYSWSKEFLEAGKKRLAEERTAGPIHFILWRSRLQNGSGISQIWPRPRPCRQRT